MSDYNIFVNIFKRMCKNKIVIYFNPYPAGTESD